MHLMVPFKFLWQETDNFIANYFFFLKNIFWFSGFVLNNFTSHELLLVKLLFFTQDAAHCTISKFAWKNVLCLFYYIQLIKDLVKGVNIRFVGKVCTWRWWKELLHNRNEAVRVISCERQSIPATSSCLEACFFWKHQHEETNDGWMMDGWIER